MGCVVSYFIVASVMLCYVMLCYVMLCYVMLCYVPFISRVFAPYGKLWTEFFLSFMIQARSAQAMETKKEKKTRIHNLPYGPSKRG